MKKQEKDKKIKIKEIFANTQYRAIIILSFYAILFIVLFMMIRMPSNNSVNENGNSITELKGYELIDNKNFAYKYTVLLNYDEYVYEGQKYGNKELLTVSKDNETEEYLFIEDKFYIKENEKYKEIITKPILIFDFFNTDILDNVIVKSTLIDSDKNRYRADNQLLYDNLTNYSAKVEEGNNYINLYYRNSNIIKIELELDNYAKVIGENYHKVMITLEYYDFNLIEDFDNITVE